MNPVMNFFHDVSPFDGVDVAQHPADFQGWGSSDSVFREAIETVKPKLIIEVGTWKGMSAIHMANITRELGLDTTVICVDTWLGSPEHILGQGPGWRESLRLEHGYPRLYYTFLSNVIQSGLTDRIVPLPATSENAAYIFREKNVVADLIYIDAAHEEAPAYRDFKDYWQLLSPGGVLIGDDYLGWEGVTNAANRFASEVNRQIVGKPGKFMLSKDASLVPQISLKRL